MSQPKSQPRPSSLTIDQLIQLLQEAKSEIPEISGQSEITFLYGTNQANAYITLHTVGLAANRTKPAPPSLGLIFAAPANAQTIAENALIQEALEAEEQIHTLLTTPGPRQAH